MSILNKSILKSLSIRLVIALTISFYVDRSLIIIDFSGILAWTLNFLTVPYLVRNENINFKVRIISAASISIIFFVVIFYFYGNQGTSGPLSNYVRMLFVLYIFSFNKSFYKKFK
jgi:predicted membrane-bound mannosyltransferase